MRQQHLHEPSKTGRIDGGRVEWKCQHCEATWLRPESKPEDETYQPGPRQPMSPAQLIVCIVVALGIVIGGCLLVYSMAHANDAADCSLRALHNSVNGGPPVDCSQYN